MLIRNALCNAVIVYKVVCRNASVRIEVIGIGFVCVAVIPGVVYDQPLDFAQVSS